MSFEEVIGQELEWRQPEAMRRFYQLMSGEQEIGSLRFESMWGSLATGQLSGRQWTFKRTGFLTPRITVREGGGEENVAVFAPGWGGGGWLAVSGRRYHMRHKNFWGTEWAFEGEDGSTAITLSGSRGVFKQGAHATVAESAARLPETPIMLLLMWYVRLLMNEDASAASAGAVVAACG
jgi:hypothetical protein